MLDFPDFINNVQNLMCQSIRKIRLDQRLLDICYSGKVTVLEYRN